MKRKHAVAAAYDLTPHDRRWVCRQLAERLRCDIARDANMAALRRARLTGTRIDEVITADDIQHPILDALDAMDGATVDPPLVDGKPSPAHLVLGTYQRLIEEWERGDQRSGDVARNVLRVLCPEAADLYDDIEAEARAEA